MAVHSWWRRLLWPAVLIAAPCLVYLHTLGYPFQYDDFHSIVDNPHLRDPRNLLAFFADPTLFSVRPEHAMYRPLLLVTLAVNWAISGSATWSYHLVNLLLHIGCGLLLWRAGIGLLGERTAAGMGALVFALHPVNSETVNYISSRSESLATFCVLLGLGLFLRRRQQGGGWVAISAVFAAGLLTKSTAVVLPALILTRDLLWAPNQIRRDRRLYAALAAIAAAYLAVGWRLVHRAAVAAPVRGYDEQLWTQVKAGVHYLVLQVVPVHLSVDHQFLLSDSLADPFAAAAALLWVSLLVLAWRARARSRLPLFLVLWWGLALAPASLVPLNVLVNEHRLYLSTAAAGLAVGSCWAEARRAGGWSRQLAPVLVTVWLAMLAGLTFQRSQVWASDYALWSDAAAKAPLMARPYIFLAEAHAREGRDSEAIRAFEEAVRRDPGFALGYARIGELLLRSGEVARARAVLETGLARTGDTVEVWAQLAEVCRAEGRWPECAAALERAVGLDPINAGLRNNLGNAYQMTGRGREALVQHAWADQLAPGDPRTWLNTGNAHLMLGEYAQAEEAFRRAVSLDPRYAEAWISLGAMLERLGKPQEALVAYRRGAAVDPAWEARVAERCRALESHPQ